MRNSILSRQTNIIRAALFFLALCCSCNVVYATGPSYIRSEIKPVSVNDQGDILCRTRFVQNPMGAHAPMAAAYGYAVISRGALTQYPGLTIEPADYDESGSGYYEAVERQDSIFNTCPDSREREAVSSMTGHRYAFTTCNAEKYRVDRTYNLEAFAQAYRTDLLQTRQKALNNAASLEYYRDENGEGSIRLQYDFGSVLFIENLVDGLDPTDRVTAGAEFDYPNVITINDGSIENVGFDISRITGILFPDLPSAVTDR